MSLVCKGRRDLPVGPTLGLEAPSPTAYVRDRIGGAAQDMEGLAVPGCFTGCAVGSTQGEAESEIAEAVVLAPSFGIGSVGSEAAEVSSDSSSIGAPDDSDSDDDGEQEVESKSNDSIGSLCSLEESLPIKRGLSNYFMGKSKSFANLSEVSTAEEMRKRENPLNKRRRMMIASKWSRKSFYSWKNPNSMPLLTLNEEESSRDRETEQEEGDDESSKEEDEEDTDERHGFRRRKQQLIGFQSCFSLTDLH